MFVPFIPLMKKKSELSVIGFKGPIFFILLPVKILLPAADDISAETETDYSKYAGKYVCLELINSNGRDDSETLRSQWEDKSHYSYYEITEDGNVILVYVDGEEKTPFSPFTITSADGDTITLSDGEQFKFEDGKMIFEYDSGARTVWEKTDEIPD